MIKFTRGDTQLFKFRITDTDNNNIEMSKIDNLILTCRKVNVLTSPVLFTKSKEDFIFEDNYYHARFEAEDTRELEYGTYNFDIEVTLNSGYVKTLKSEFTITEEDTIYQPQNNN